MAGNSNFAKLLGVNLAQEFLTQNRMIFITFLTVCAARAKKLVNIKAFFHSPPSFDLFPAGNLEISL